MPVLNLTRLPSASKISYFPDKLLEAARIAFSITAFRPARESEPRRFSASNVAKAPHLSTGMPNGMLNSGRPFSVTLSHP
jgi:hypothetical protein